MREFLGLKLEVMFLSKYQLKKLNRKERQEYLTVKKRYIRFQEALKTGMIKHIKNAHEFNKFQHEQDEHYLDDTYDKVINTNYSKIKKKEKKVDKISVIRETPVVREERIVETNNGMKNIFKIIPLIFWFFLNKLITVWGGLVFFYLLNILGYFLYIDSWQWGYKNFFNWTIFMTYLWIPILMAGYGVDRKTKYDSSGRPIDDKGFYETYINTKKGAIIILIPWFIGIFFIMEFFPLSN